MRLHQQLVLAASLLGAFGVQANTVNFESQHVHPIALSLDGKLVYAVNTPDNRLMTQPYNGAVGPGLVEIAWNGRSRQQVPVASDRYYSRIFTPRGSTSRSLLIIR